MSEPNQPPSSPERFWRPAPELPPQPEFQLPPDPSVTRPAPVFIPPSREYAGFVVRVFAAIIDWLLLIPMYFLSIVIGTLVETTGSGGDGLLWVLLGYSCAFTFSIWNSVVRQGLTGASLGKSWMHIRVVGEESGHEIGIARSFARYALNIVNALPFNLGYLWPIWDGKKQTFADKIMGTVVLTPVSHY